ncbi:MAG: hypothetical protein MCM46_15910 [Candidatus Manganitrophus sp. SB1]|nr:hypothetical protein [Candidatus Manganitrophus morganii]
MKGLSVLFVSLILIWVFAESGFSQNALVSGNQIDREISSVQIFSNPNDVPSLVEDPGSITGKVIEIGPGGQIIEVETKNGIRRSYRIDSGIRFEHLQKRLKEFKKGDTVRFRLATRGVTEVITEIEKIE